MIDDFIRKTILVVLIILTFGCNTDKSKKKELDYLFWNASLKTENNFIKKAVKELEIGDSDLIMQKYNTAETREEVIDFFTKYTKNREISQTILKYSAKFDVPPTLSFALAFTESSFNPRAVNRNKITIDRGLFQLNSSSFPSLSEKEFFDIDKNAYNGIKYIRWCLDTGGNEVSALAMYNAGLGRVSGGGTPRQTLDYISKIQTLRGDYQNNFNLDVELFYIENQPGPKLVKDIFNP